MFVGQQRRLNGMGGVLRGDLYLGDRIQIQPGISRYLGGGLNGLDDSLAHWWPPQCRGE
jgi:hypothetical protein